MTPPHAVAVGPLEHGKAGERSPAMPPARRGAARHLAPVALHGSLDLLAARLAVAALTIGLLAGDLQPVPVMAATPGSPGLAGIPVVELPPLDLEAIRIEDAERATRDAPHRFAIPHAVSITPASAGSWHAIDATTSRWQLRVTSPGAQSLNLGFERFHMPPGGELALIDTHGSARTQRYTPADNDDHGQLWTPVVPSDDIVLELTIADKSCDALDLELAAINVGYRDLDAPLDPSLLWCMVDVVCPVGDAWRMESASVTGLSLSGFIAFSGFLVNNTAVDETPYLMTAYHTGINPSNAASLVAYWNHESPNCGDRCCGPEDHAQTGAVLVASYANSDFILLRLDDDPAPEWNVVFAGWNRGEDPPASAVAIHHSGGREKAISFEFDPCWISGYGIYLPGDLSHIRVNDWDIGSVEPGASGSPLFDQNHRVVGQRHGGLSNCNNDEAMWYGRFAVSWAGGGTPATRLSDWLDPLQTGAMSIGHLPANPGMQVSPAGDFVSEGPEGGPFTPVSRDYLVQNWGGAGFDYHVSCLGDWLTLTGDTGYLAPGATATVTVTVNASASALQLGLHHDVLTFENLSTHEGDAERDIRLLIGPATLAHGFPLSSDPGWSTDMAWAFGQPTGGGSYNGDPTSGYTGSNVYGYNLAGDYTSLMPEAHLTSDPIDCTLLGSTTLRFQRWLGVERNAFDHAYVRVSTDGVSWTTVWENGNSNISDASWTAQEIDISEVADLQPTVYLRWTMGITDDTVQYPGWNIDDIEIWGRQVWEAGIGVADAAPAPAGIPVLRIFPNPGHSQYRFDVEDGLLVQIFDVAGRLVAALPPGQRTWQPGTGVASGVYLVRAVEPRRGAADESGSWDAKAGGATPVGRLVHVK